MTERNSTCVCQVCGTPYLPTLNKDGSPRKTLHKLCGSPECRKATPAVRTRVASKGQCSADSCGDMAKVKGLCHKHYKVSLLRGDPNSVIPKRVEKACGHCGTLMVLRPAEAKKRTACSQSCASFIKAKAWGHTSRKKSIVCAYCAAETVVTAWKAKDKVRFCNNTCRGAMVSKIADECNALRRIAERQRPDTSTLVKAEVAALRRIGRAARAMCRCAHCSKPYARKQSYQRYCSEGCRSEAHAEARARYRSSDFYRAARRNAKTRRMAAMRGCEHENIDPIKVFERDKWKCHLCGIKTLKKLRGTYDDRAPELEHIVSLAHGGSHTWGNVACSCRKCNIAKGSASVGQLGLGFAA